MLATEKQRDPPASLVYAEDWIGRRAVRIMSFEERGLLISIRAQLWQDAMQPLPADAESLAAIIGRPAADIRRALTPAVLAELEVVDCQITDLKLQRYWNERARVRAAQAAAGQRTGRQNRSRHKQLPPDHHSAYGDAQHPADHHAADRKGSEGTGEDRIAYKDGAMHPSVRDQSARDWVADFDRYEAGRLPDRASADAYRSATRGR
jgi:hypothetical protein